MNYIVYPKNKEQRVALLNFLWSKECYWHRNFAGKPKGEDVEFHFPFAEFKKMVVDLPKDDIGMVAGNTGWSKVNKECSILELYEIVEKWYQDKHKT